MFTRRFSHICLNLTVLHPHRLILLIKPYISGYTTTMKINIKKLPNFRDLHNSSPTSKQEYLSLLAFYFFTASICGFLWEVLIFLIKEDHFRNRGFFYGPWLPVYGTGAVLMYLLLSGLKRQPIKVFLYSLLIGTSLELAIGWILDYFWELRYWDYTGYLLNFRGYICLTSALGFGIAGALWICLFSALLMKFWFHIPEKIRHIITIILILSFILDCTAALIFPNTGRGITFPAAAPGLTPLSRIPPTS